MKNKLTIYIVCLVLGLTACQSNSNTAEAPSDAVSLRLDKPSFTEKIKTMANAKLIDVRTPEEFQQGAIEGAINIDFNGDNFETQLNQLDKTQPTLIYCQSGGRSGKTLKKMRNMGFQEVYELKTGYGSWK